MAANATAAATSYRYELSRVAARGARAGVSVADITGRVVRVTPLEERGEEMPGVVRAGSVTLECIPDEELAADGRIFGARAAGDVVELRIWKSYTARDDELIFAGALTAEPEYRDALEEATLILRFAGRLAGLWDDAPVELRAGDETIAWGHAGDALLPALLAAATSPPGRRRINVPALTADEPFWSYFGDPAAGLQPPGGGRYDVRALAWDSKRALVYVGVGPYVRSFEPATRRWRTTARVRYAGGAPEPRGVTWRVAHLEYDAAADRILGVAESAGADVTKRATHLKARFCVDL